MVWQEPLHAWKETSTGRRVCKHCGRTENLWGRQFAEGFVPEEWTGPEVTPDECWWHKEETNAREERHGSLHMCLDLLKRVGWAH